MSNSCSVYLDKAHTKQQRPSTAKNEIIFLKDTQLGKREPREIAKQNQKNDTNKMRISIRRLKLLKRTKQKI